MSPCPAIAIFPRNGVEPNSVPCRCMICGEAFDIGEGRPNQLWGKICTDCGAWLCPRCGAHDLIGPVPFVCDVPANYAAHERASVWGRPN